MECPACKEIYDVFAKKNQFQIEFEKFKDKNIPYEEKLDSIPTGKFGSTEEREDSVSRYPILLLCGHLVCNSCFKLSSDGYQCSECLQFTSLEDCISHKYIIGHLAVPSCHSLDLWFSKALDDVKKTCKLTSRRNDLCEECMESLFEVDCSDCETRLCKSCSRKIHKQNNYKCHSITKFIFDENLYLKDCPEHHELCDVICKTCGDVQPEIQMICNSCASSPSHRHHSVTQVKSSEYLEEATEIENSLKTALKLLKKDFKVCADCADVVDEEGKKAVSALSEDIWRFYANAHAALQLQERQQMESLTRVVAQKILAVHEDRTRVLGKLLKTKKYLKVLNKKNVASSPFVNLALLIPTIREEMSSLQPEDSPSTKRFSELLSDSYKWARIEVAAIPPLLSVAPEEEEAPSSDSDQDEDFQKETQVTFESVTSTSLTLDRTSELTLDRTIELTLDRTSELSPPKKENLPQRTSETEKEDLGESLEDEVYYEGGKMSPKEDLGESLEDEVYYEGGKMSPKEDRRLRSVGVLMESLREGAKDTTSEKDSTLLTPIPVYAEEYYEVILAHFENPGQFHVQCVRDKENLESLSTRLNQKDESRESSLKVEIGCEYLGCFSDDMWYRALVTDSDPERELANCLYVDYGNTEALPYARLADCPSELRLDRVPPFALECSIHDLLPFALECSIHDLLPEGSDGWMENSKKFFMETIENHRTFMLYCCAVLENKLVRRCTVDVSVQNLLRECSYLPVSLRDCLIFHEFALSSLQENDNKKASDRDRNWSWRKPIVWPLIELLSNPVHVRVAHLDSPSNFSIVNESHHQSLCELESQLQSHYNARKLRMLPEWQILLPKLKMPCVAMNPIDDRWHRAEVSEVRDMNSIDVTFVDIGLRLNLSIDFLRKIKDEFVQLPAQGIPCKLAHVVHPQEEAWGELTIDRFKYLLETNAGDIQATFCKRVMDVYEVALRIGRVEVKDVSLTLIDEELAEASEETELDSKRVNALRKARCLEMEDGIPVRRRRKKVVAYSGRRYAELMPTPTRAPKKEEAESQRASSSRGISHSVDFLFVLSPDFIDVRFSSDKFRFLEFQNNLVKLDSGTNDDYAPHVGDICGVHLNKSPHFVRAKVLLANDSSSKVHFVDCGGVSDQPFSSLRSLPDSVKTADPFAVTICLANIIPPCGSDHWPNTTIDTLREGLMTREKLYMIRRGISRRNDELWRMKILPTELGWEEEEEADPFEPVSSVTVSFGALLVDKGLALPGKKCAEEKVAASAESFSSSEKPRMSGSAPKTAEVKKPSVPRPLNGIKRRGMDMAEGELAFFPPAPQLKVEKFRAEVTNVDLKGHLYLHPIAHRATLEHMRKEHQARFSDSEITNEDICWIEGDYVVAKFHIDNEWYRAKVLQIREGEVWVQFIDYGNKELIQVSDIRGKNVFSTTPIQCYKCVLYGVVPTSKWTLELLNWLHEYVVEVEWEVSLKRPHRRGHKLKVDLVKLRDNPSCETLSDYLVKVMMICKRISSSLASRADSDADARDVVETETDEGRRRCFSPLQLPRNPSVSQSQSIAVSVSLVRNTSEVYIIPKPEVTDPLEVTPFVKYLKEVHSKFEEFERSLLKHIGSKKGAKNPKIGEVYMAFVMGKEKWCRGRVLEVGSSSITVFSIDEGFEAEINKNWLYELSATALEFPGLCLPVQLRGVAPLDPEDESFDAAVESLRNCLVDSTEQIYASVEVWRKDRPEVNLYLKDRDGLSHLCYDHLADEGVIRFE